MAGKTNPFTLTFGKQPHRLVLRREKTEQIINDFTAEYSVSQIYLIEGIRGSGKTVLMTTVAKQLEKDGWVIINLNSAMNLLEGLASRLNKACKRTADMLKKGFNVSVAGTGFGFGGSESQKDPVSVIEDCVEYLQDKGKRVLITVDEVQNDQNMRIFASQFQIFIRQDYPLYLLMTGMYENIYAVQNDPALTFLLRAPKIRTEALGLLQIRNQYREVFAIGDTEAMKLAEITKGYAFAFQAVGTVYWENHKELSIPEMLRKLDEMLDEYVYRKIWSTLSGREQEIVSSMGEGVMKVEEVRQGVDMSSATFSQYREKMIAKGILNAPRYGYVEIALPRFSEVAKTYRLT